MISNWPCKGNRETLNDDDFPLVSGLMTSRPCLGYMDGGGLIASTCVTYFPSNTHSAWCHAIQVM